MIKIVLRNNTPYTLPRSPISPRPQLSQRCPLQGQLHPQPALLWPILSQRSIVADFISSLSALSIPAPSITSWWSATSLYSPVSPTCLSLGRVFLDDACSQASRFCKDN
ncbi:hypothetical protein ZIOFF_000704 [Zingiber officinale]|uniref:Uncharacterized protein n=1 Tax=Zingiber officinale TaxID=94328 RepID=A0A8J5LY06_ZINOF|nr:hypothetical protein ZIOFF_000704 [Zingiber officinale]